MRSTIAIAILAVSFAFATEAFASCRQVCRYIPVKYGVTAELRLACQLVCVADDVANAQQRYQQWADPRFGPRVQAMRNNAYQNAYPYPQIMGPPPGTQRPPLVYSNRVAVPRPLPRPVVVNRLRYR